MAKRVLISNGELFFFDNKYDADQFAASEITKHIDQEAILFPGGSSPLSMFEIISEKINEKLIEVIPTDERLVPISSEESNFKALKKYFKNVFQIYKDSASNEDMARSYCEKISSININTLVIGAGCDCHIASLFPNNVDFESQAKDLLNKKNMPPAFTTYVDSKGWRASISLSTIVNTKTVILFCTGKDKRHPIDRILNPSSKPKLPVDFLRFANKLTVITDTYA